MFFIINCSVIVALFLMSYIAHRTGDSYLPTIVNPREYYLVSEITYFGALLLTAVTGILFALAYTRGVL